MRREGLIPEVGMMSRIESIQRRLAILAAAGLLAGALLWTAPARAESVFSREGIGEWLEDYDGRGEALGSTGIGVIDIHNFAGLNPAATAFSRKSMGYAGIGSTIRWTTDGVNDQRRPSTAISGLGAHIALPSGLGLRFGLGAATDGAYALEERVATGWEAAGTDVRREEGTRGLLRYTSALTWAYRNRYALGAGLGVYAGSLLDETSYTFGDSAQAAGWEPGGDQMRLRFHPATFFQIGALARPLAPLTLGGFVATGSHVKVTGTYQSFGGKEWERRSSTIDLPFGYGLGAALQLGSRWRLSGDLVGRQWADVELDDLALPQPGLGPFRNTLRWGAGLEWLGSSDPGASYLSSIHWRAGFAAIPWYIVDASGAGVDEWRLSLGAGLPVQRDRGSLDFFVAWGRRGSQADNGVEEDYFRFGFASVFSGVLREY
jgi:hypothetical protein